MLRVVFLCLMCSWCVAEVKIIAHRGASAEAPENTLSAFKKALEIGVSCIECDVHLTKDEVVVISHDPEIPYDHSQSTVAKIPTMVLSQLALYDVGKWFHPRFTNEQVPTLEDVLQLKRGDTALMIELKHGMHDSKKLVKKVLELLQKTNAKKVYMGSFDSEIVRLLQESDCRAQIQGICSTYNDFFERFPRAPKHVVMKSDCVTPDVINAFHKQGREVWTFTVDSPSTARRLIGYGIDGIITNDPRAIREVVSQR